MVIEEIIESVSDLPPTPQILPKLLKLLWSFDSGIYDIVELVKVDAPLTAQVVKLSNSAYYGASQRCDSLEEAITRVGFKEVYHLVSMIAANKVLNRSLVTYNMGSDDLFGGSLACATLMENLVDHSPEDRNTGYTIGLLHLIGKVVINQHILDDHKSDSPTWKGQKPQDLNLESPEEERLLVGFDHAEVAGALLRKWNFPDNIVTPIECQVSPEKAADNIPQTYQLYVALWILNQMGMELALGNDEEEEKHPLPLADISEALEKAQISVPRMQEVIAQGRNYLSRVKRDLRLS